MKSGEASANNGISAQASPEYYVIAMYTDKTRYFVKIKVTTLQHTDAILESARK